MISSLSPALAAQVDAFFADPSTPWVLIEGDSLGLLGVEIVPGIAAEARADLEAWRPEPAPKSQPDRRQLTLFETAGATPGPARTSPPEQAAAEAAA